KVIAGFLPFTILFGLDAGVPFWLCVLLPFSIAGAKMAVAAYTLWEYENRKKVYNENRMQKYVWLCAGVLLAAAYGLPAAKVTIPQPAVGVLLILFAAAGAVGMRKILTFEKYRQINQEMLADMMNQMDTTAQVVQKQSQKSISTDTGITSNKKGFEYLNELFVKRHRKILWKSSRRLAVIALIMFAGMLLACGVSPAFRTRTNEILMVFLPYFVFIMYAINRGNDFTRALFMNCDHSLLTYSFYKHPGMVLQLFRIRLREIIKVNLLP